MIVRLIILLCFIKLNYCSEFDNEVDDNEDGVVRVPLIRKKSTLQRILDSGVHPREFERAVTNLYSNGNGGLAPVPLFKYLDTEFYGEVLIGHPGQKFKVVFDTMWANSWVPSVLCPVIDVACIMRSKYDASKSSTYVKNNKPFNIAIQSRVLKGKLSTDLFHIGQVNVTNQTFAEINQIPWPLMFEKADGVVGLAFEEISVDNVVPLFYNMVIQKVVNQSIFAFYMNRDPSSKKGGTLMFGGVETRHYLGNFTDVKIIPTTGTWSFELNGITTTKKGSASFCTSGCTASADTSENTIRGPPDDIDMLNQIIGAQAFYFGRYIVSCSTMAMLPRVNFVINNKNFTLKSSDYIQKMTWGPITICLSSFKKTEYQKPNNWILGGAFLSKFYVKFDLEKLLIGFADARL